MPLYVTVSEGPRADRARPVLAISDQHMIAELLHAIGRWGEDRAAEVEEQTPRAPTLRALGCPPMSTGATPSPPVARVPAPSSEPTA